MGKRSRAFDPAGLARTVLFVLRESPRNLKALVSVAEEKYDGVTPTSVRYLVDRHVKEQLVKRKGELYGLTERGLKRVEYYKSEGFVL